MKAWAWTLILLSLSAKFAKTLLPRGERSPLYAPLRFLLSLCLIAVIFSPWVPLVQNGSFQPSSLDFGAASSVDGDQIILEKMGKTMKTSVDTAFPTANYTLEIYTDENQIPTEIAVICDETETAKEIARFIENNYGLETVEKKRRS